MPFVLFPFCKRAEEPSRACDNVNISSSRYETKTSCRAPYRKKGIERDGERKRQQFLLFPFNLLLALLRIDSECVQPTRRFFCGMSVCIEKREKKNTTIPFVTLSILLLLLHFFIIIVDLYFFLLHSFEDFLIAKSSEYCIRDDHGS